MLRVPKKGRIVAIYIAPPACSDPMPIGGHAKINEPISVAEVEAVMGMGLKGDRWFGVNALQRSDGIMVPNNHVRNVSFFEEEKVAEVRQLGFDIKPTDIRRNILVRNFSLNELVDKDFYVGTVRFRGTRLSHGCDRIEKLLGIKGINKALYMRGGIRAEVLSDGIIKVGDEIRCC